MANRIFFGISLVPRIIIVVLLFAVLVDMMLGVFFRYVVGQALPWTEEVGTLGLIWLTFLSAALGVNRAAHFSIQVAVERLPLDWQRSCRLLIALLIMVNGALLTYFGWVLAESNSVSQTPALQLNLGGAMYAPAAVGGALIAWYGGVLGLATLRRREAPRAD